MKEKGMSKGGIQLGGPGQWRHGGNVESGSEGSGYAGPDPLSGTRGQAGENSENPQVIKTPVVRNGKQSTLGYQLEVWKGWS